MAIFKCKMCGGTIEFNQGDTVGVCDSCGTKQTLPNTNDDVIANLYNRANNLRLKSEFDRAAKVYEDIVNKDDSQAEAHWGIVLCKYGIEYVEDPETKKRIPTCHRASYEAIRSDADYLAAIDYADGGQQAIYEAEARDIDKIQKGILAIAKEEKPFDVFICYKETDESGNRTQDSVIANDIYYQLTQEGFKVFYAAITLEDKLGQEYEPYIFAALNSAKVMLVIGTNPEYFNAVWVKNEWSRYLKLIKNDRSRLLIPCYRDMDAYDLPEEFAHLQAQDMSKIGFINDVTRGIRKVLSDNKEQTKETVVINSGNAEVEPLLKRAFMFLEDGDWDRADEFAEQVLNREPENASAYIVKLMVDLKVERRDDLANLENPFDDNANYQKALRFADTKLSDELKGYIDTINNRNFENAYQFALDKMKTAETEEDYNTASEFFAELGDYKDSLIKKEECLEKAEKAKAEREAKIKEAVRVINAKYSSNKDDNNISGIQSQIDKTNRDISALNTKIGNKTIQSCETDKAKTEQQITMLKEELSSIGLFKGARKREINDEIQSLQSKLSNIQKFADAIITRDSLLKKLPSLHSKLENAKKEEAERTEKGISTFSLTYEQAIAVINELSDIELAQLSLPSVFKLKSGDVFTFGKYEWYVLKRDNTKLLLITKDCVGKRAYNTESKSITWENCTLRSYLNGQWYSCTFSDEEKALIQTTDVVNSDNSECGTDGGNDTKDKIFLLSIDEVNKCFSINDERIANYNGKADWWWLRSPGGDNSYAALVCDDGHIYSRGGDISYADPCFYGGNGGVRPALWIDLS